MSKKTTKWRNRVIASQYVDPETLVENDKNWRVHPAYQRRALESVIDKVGWVKQIIVNKRTGVILDGHLRVSLALERKEATVPVDFVDLDENEEALVLASLDPLAAMARTDDQAIRTLLSSIPADDDTDSLLDEIRRREGIKSIDTMIDDVTEPAELKALKKKWKTGSGQMWLIGDHKLLIGDCREVAQIKRLMGPERAACVFTDPPYGVDYKARSGKHEKIENDDLVGDNLVRFLASAFTTMMPHTNNDAAFYIWHAPSTRREFEKALHNAGLEERQYLIWVKPAAVMGWGDYRWAHEPCFYACRRGENPMFYGDRDNTTTWRVAAARSDEGVAVNASAGIIVSDGENNELFLNTKAPKNKRAIRVQLDGKPALVSATNATDDVWEVSRHGKAYHPTEKPQALARRAILNSTQEREIVLDIFGGTGGTLLACEDTDRRCRMVELEPGYAAVTLERASERGLKFQLDQVGLENLK